MSDRMALKIAIDLMHVPSEVRLVRSKPLPKDVQMLLRIAAGHDEIDAYDCYVAFFGNMLPTGSPKEKPYPLRYSSTSLTVLGPAQDD